MFSSPVAHVSGTRIFARLLDESGQPPKQVLIYAMKLAVSDDVAMLLPVPTPAGAGEQALRFVSLEGYADLFDDLDRQFPAPIEPQSGAPESVSLGASRALLLEVHRVGAFDASFVPSRADFERLDPRFRLADEIMDALPYDDSWGYAVFKLHASSTSAAARERRGPLARLLARVGMGDGHPRQPAQAHTQDIHPMAFVFETRKAESLFFPTIHVHAGSLPARASFDHQLYFQTSPTIDFQVPELELDTQQAASFGAPMFSVDHSFGPLGRKLDAARTQDLFDLIDKDSPGVRVSVVGSGPNRDIEIGLAARPAPSLPVTSPSELVCFCFGHTASDVRAGRREDGTNTVVEAITQACRQGLSRCAEKNPSGRCCLGVVRAIAGDTNRPCCSSEVVKCSAGDSRLGPDNGSTVSSEVDHTPEGV